ILSLYRNDIMKIDSLYRSKVLAIFDQIPGLLSKQDKRVVFKKIVENSDFSSYEDTFFWLEDSMIANVCFNCADPNVGLALNEERTYVKCYMGDTGLLVSHTFSESEFAGDELCRELLHGKLSLNEGMFFENLVAQMLVSLGHKLYYYIRYNRDSHRNDIEIDFIVSNNSKLKYRIYPIEVKSTDHYQTRSLAKFIDVFRQRIGGSYVIHTKNLKEENGITYIPAYMIFCL
ncbi:MAG: DUF4143 domain-containing protein, partial [Clostridium sp.]|nr:DUF4143 domain-containing protein [Clostridium sp.]